jgi:hypothetical protein
MNVVIIPLQNSARISLVPPHSSNEKRQLALSYVCPSEISSSFPSIYQLA